MVLVDEVTHTLELAHRQRRHQFPADREGVHDRPAGVALADDLLLEVVRKVQIATVGVRQRFLTDDGDQATEVM